MRTAGMVSFALRGCPSLCSTSDLAVTEAA
jgi:hypothetical protein